MTWSPTSPALTASALAALALAALALAAAPGLAHAAAAQASPAAATAAPLSPAMQAVVDYVHGQKTTGFLVIQDGRVLVERNWPVPPDAGMFRAMSYGEAPDGALLEDVASQQKSYVSMLVAIAVDKGLIDVETPVAAYIGPGWSKASRDQEAKIRVLDVLNMSSGLKEDFTYAAPPATVFLYNTPVYAITKRVVAAAAHQPLETITRDWLTGPAGMTQTSWRKRPASMADVGNPTGLVTTPRDVARFGAVVLARGLGPDGRRIVSEAQLDAMFRRAPTNPSYGRLWWLNGGAYAVKPLAARVDGPLIPAAPADTVAALGALDRKLYVSPSHRLIVVRMGQATPDRRFDETLWEKLTPAVR